MVHVMHALRSCRGVLVLCGVLIGSNFHPGHHLKHPTWKKTVIVYPVQLVRAKGRFRACR